MLGSGSVSVTFSSKSPRRPIEPGYDAMSFSLLFNIKYLLLYKLARVLFGVDLAQMEFIPYSLFLVNLVLPIVDVIFGKLFVPCATILWHLLDCWRNCATEAIMHGILLTFNYYSAPRIIFEVTGALQILIFCVSDLGAEFDTPSKIWIKTNCSGLFLDFLASTLKLKYFSCSNPVERRVFTTHLFFTNGAPQLYTRGFELSRFVEVEHDRPRDKVTVTSAGPEHTLFTIEGVKKGILVKTGPRLNEQKEILEYIAHNPAACFVKEVDGFCGKYCPIEEYPQLLDSNDVYMCRFLTTAPDLSDEHEIDLLPWMGSGTASRFCKILLRTWIEYTEVYAPAESTRVVQRHIYLKTSFPCRSIKLSWRLCNASDGILMF